MVQLNDIYKTSIVYILCIDETKLDSNIENAQFHLTEYTAQKMKFSIKDLFSKCDQILSRKLNFLYSVISGEKMLMSGELKGSVT